MGFGLAALGLWPYNSRLSAFCQSPFWDFFKIFFSASRLHYIANQKIPLPGPFLGCWRRDFLLDIIRELFAYLNYIFTIFSLSCV